MDNDPTPTPRGRRYERACLLGDLALWGGELGGLALLVLSGWGGCGRPMGGRGCKPAGDMPARLSDPEGRPGRAEQAVHPGERSIQETHGRATREVAL